MAEIALKFEDTEEYVPSFDETSEVVAGNPDPQALYSQPVQNIEMDILRGANAVWLNQNSPAPQGAQLDAQRDAYMDVENSSDEGMYQAMSEVIKPSVEAINASEILNNWTGSPDDTLTAPTGNRWNRFLNNKKYQIASFWAGGTEEGGHKVAMSLLDFWPSTYRGTKQLIGLEDFDVPAIDKIADFTGGLKKDADIRREIAINHMKESGHFGTAATAKALDAVGDTLVFLNEVKRLNMSYGGNAASGMTRWGKALSTMGHATKMALFKSLTAEDVGVKERAEMFAISWLYMATPAVSGQASGEIAPKVYDFFLNSAISALKEGGYKDIAEDETMDAFDKTMAAVELVGFDAAFSSRTTGYDKAMTQVKESGLDIDKLFKDMTVLNPRAVEPRVTITPADLARAEVGMSGRGGIEIDKADAEAKAIVEKTKATLEKEIAETKKPIETESKEGDKKPAEPTDKDLELARKEAILDVIKETEGQPAEKQMIAMQKRIEQLGETIGDNAPIKTQINRINRVRKSKPKDQMTMAQFYKTMEKVSKDAAKASLSGVADVREVYSKWATENLTWKEAEAFDGKLDGMIGKKASVDALIKGAEKEALRLMAPKRVIERTIPIKDLSAKTDLTEAEALRTVLRASEKAAIGARRATIDKITMTNKDMKKVIDGMPKDVRESVMKSAMAVAQARTDDARDKAIVRFREKASSVVEKYEIKQAEKEYDKARKGAEKLVSSGEVSPAIKTQIEALVSGITKKSIGEDLALELDKLDTYEGAQMAVIARELAQMPAIDKMNAEEIREQADMLNGLVHQMKQTSKELYEYGKTKAQADVASQENLLASNSWAFKQPREGKLGATIDKVSSAVHRMQFDSIMIPRGVAENLDFLDKGTFTKLQDRLEASNIDISRVERDAAQLFEPHEKFMSSKGYAKNKDEKMYKATGEDGKERDVELGIGHRLRIYLASKDVNTAEVMKEVGWKTELKDDRWFLSDKETAKILSDMSPQEKAVGESYVELGKLLGGYLDTKSMEINGFPLSKEGWTAPQFRIGSSFMNKQGDMDFGVDIDKGRGFNEQMVKFSVESSGRFKKRTGSKEALLMYNPVTVMKGVERIVATYYGRADSLREANKFLYESKKGGDKSLQTRYAKAGKEDTYNTFSDYIKELNGERDGKPQNSSAKVLKKIANVGVEYTAGAIKYNPKVELVQLASLPTAATVLSKTEAQDMYKAFGSGKGASIEEMSRRAPYLWSRYNGKLGIMLGDDKLAKKKERGYGGIKKRDAKVIGSIFRAKENAILAKNPDMKGEELDRAVEREVLSVIMRTQPSFEDVSRPELARSDNPLARMITIFSSQRNKNFYLGWKEYANVMKKQEAGTLTRKDLNKARNVMGNLALANGIFAAINTVAQNLMEEVMDMRGTRNLDDEGQWDDWVKEYVANFATAGLSSAGAWMSMASSAMQGFDLERTPVSAIWSDVQTVKTFDNDLEELQKGFDEGNAGEVFKENAQKYGKHLTTYGNVIAQPMTGVNIKNLYKWFVEAPLAVKRTVAPSVDQKIDRYEKMEKIQDEKLKKKYGE